MTRLKPAVAAGHPATAEAGAEILGEGGSAADAAIGACLASCVAETVMTGLLGGGHAIYFDAGSGDVRSLDCFVAVPGAGAKPRPTELFELHVPFGAELVHYAVGIASCGVPGVPAGLHALHQAHGRMPWRRLVEPALRLARSGVEMLPAHAACLEMLAPVMTMNEGARIYSPSGRVLQTGDRLDQPGLVAALELLADEGAGSVYGGTIAELLLGLMDERGGLVTLDDLRAYRAVWEPPAEAAYAGRRILTRAGLSRVPATLERLPPLAGCSERERVLALVDVLASEAGNAHTTNITGVDAEGSACVLTTSLGLGSGDFISGLDLHLNSMLGETDLLRGSLEPGLRMESMMAPTLAFSEDALELAIGAAGGTRLRTALVGVTAAILDERLEPQAAVDRPRFHPSGRTIHAEPGVDETALDDLERRGDAVRRWPEQHHYFGGVSLVGQTGAAADPRRNGAVRTPR
jgi:gamma-glutamyltranspeptidase / glutathione hydrolase